MDKEPSSHRVSASNPPHGTRMPSQEFLEAEYSVANQWAMHGENLSHRIFSFYVTLVTATLAGALAIGQGLSPTFQSSLLILGAACFILILAGPVFYEALVHDHIRNIGYRKRMDQIRRDLAENYGSSPSQAAGPQPPAPQTRESALRDPYHPSAIQHTLVGLINSILVALAIPSILWGIAGPGYRILPAMIASVTLLFVSFVLHRIAARIILQRYVSEI